MITRRSLLLIGCLALLSGCFRNPCVGPGLQVSDIWVPECTYKVMITHVDMTKYVVTGIIPGDQDVIVDGKKSKFEYTFHVVDLDKLGNNVIKKDGTYWFLRKGNSPYLELYPGEPIRGINYKSK